MSRAARLLVLVVGALTPVVVAPPLGVRPACAEEPSIDDLVAQLGGPDVAARSKAYTALRARDAGKVSARLADHAHELESTGQYYAVLLLNGFPHDASERALRSWTRGKTPYLRVCAAQILDQRGEKGMAGVIEKELARDDLPAGVWQRMMVWLRYGRVPKDDGLYAALVAPLERTDPAVDPVVALETAYVLEGVGDAATQFAVPAFGKLLADPRPGVRLTAAALLYRLGEGDGTPLIAAFRAGGADSGVYYFVRDVFYRAPVRAPTPEIVDAALAATRLPASDSDLRALVTVIEVLGDKRATERLVELASHESSVVAKAAADAYAKLTGAQPDIGVTGARTDAEDTVQLAQWIKKRDTAKLVAWLADETVARRLAAADALRRMDDRQGLVVVLEALVGTDVAARRDAARILGGFRAEEGVAPLIDATLDDDVTVRTYARTALQATLQTLFPQRRFQMTNRGGRHDDDPAVRAERARTLKAWWTERQAQSW